MLLVWKSARELDVTLRVLTTQQAKGSTGDPAVTFALDEMCAAAMEGGMAGRVTSLLTALSFLLASAAMAGPVSYQTTWADANGKQHPVSFNGTADGTNVSGTLVVDAVELKLSGVI